MYRDAWGFGGDNTSFFSVGTKKQKNLCEYVWGHPHALCFWGVAPQANFAAWGFVWGGFAWVCDTGVSLLYAGPNQDPWGCTTGDFQTILAGIGQKYIQHDP